MSGALTWIQENFYSTFIEKNRYQLFLEGLKNTLTIVVFAALIGCVLGILVACADMGFRHATKRNPVRYLILKVLNAICKVYIAIIRGTPLVVQLMYLYFVIFTNVKNGILVAILGFGLNSGAYVAEIVRAGIMSVDIGQTEAGRSLGMTSLATTSKIVLPQAIKNILPALVNEFIALIKETSVAGLITITDLTRAGDMVRSNTAEPFFSLTAVAIVYLIIVGGLTFVLRRVERRLRKSDRS